MKEKINNIITCFFIGIVILACLFFSGCNGSKSAVRKLARIDSRHKPVVDGYFAMTRPCVDSTDVRVIYKPGEVITDTLIYVEYETLNDTVTRYVTKYVNKIQRDTIVKTEFQKQTDKSKDGVYQDKIRIATEALNKEQVEHSATKQSLKTYKTGFYILLAIIVVCVVIKLFWGKITGWFK